MADLSTTLPLIPSSIHKAYSKIQTHVHKTPLLTNKTINNLASTPSSAGTTGPSPKFNIYFKCENYQRIGAFKARGAFHAVTHLIDELGLEEVRRRGVVTHSSGNHAQALSLAASSFNIPAHIVMPTISTPSKIAGTRSYTSHIYFSGSTSDEREAVVKEVIEKTGAILVPPYDHPDIMLGQGTTALELHQQYDKLKTAKDEKPDLKVVLAPLGGGGLLSGITIYFSDQPTYVLGCEPSFQGGNDGEMGFKASPQKRVEKVKTLTIADGLRTPVGELPWKVFTITSGSSTKSRSLENIYSVDEEQIKNAMRLVLERMKVFIEPSAAVPLAVVLYNEEFRRWAYEKQREEGQEIWDIAVVFSGGNTTIEAIVGLFGESQGKGKGKDEERAEGKVGMDGERVAENVAG